MNDETLKKKVQVVVIAEASVLLFEFNDHLPGNYVGFQNITGGVEGDETFPAAAERELVEEAGFSGEVFDINLQFEFHDRWKKNCLEKVFLCSLKTKPKVTLSAEHRHFEWVPLNEVTEKNYRFPTNYQAFLRAKNFLEDKK